MHRVKILFNKKDSALIQFSDGLQAQTGDFSCIDSNVLQSHSWRLGLCCINNFACFKAFFLEHLGIVLSLLLLLCLKYISVSKFYYFFYME